jgi:O-antigen/teichoic acid export membrane protein
MTNKLFKLIERITPIKWHWVLNHDGYKRYFANTGWMFGGKFITLGISFFISIYIARYLGPSNYGLLNYVISFVGLFAFLSSFGVDGIVSREIIKDHDKKDEIIGTAFYLKIIGSLLAILSIVIVSISITKDIFTLGLILLFSLNFIPQAFNVIETYFQSQVLSKKVVTAQFIANIISTILKVLCIILGKGIFWLTLIYVVETSIYALILVFSFRKFGNHLRKWKFNINIAKNLLKDSWPLMLSSIAIGIYMKIDQVMIKNMLGNEQAGIYAVAVRLSEVWYFIPGIICTSLFPAIINAMHTDNELFISRMRKLYFLVFWFSIIMAVFVTIFSYGIIKILFGLQYMAAITTLQIYVWAGISVSLGIASSQYLLAKNMTKIFFYNTLFGAMVNVILNMILIPKMGINGAAFATLISYTVATFGVLMFSESRNQGLLILKSIISYK